MAAGTGSIFDTLRRDGAPIVVYGAYLRLTDLVRLALRRNGFQPACLTDGRRELAGGNIDGMPILTPEDMLEKYRDAHIFICPSNEFWSVWDFLWENGATRLHNVEELTADIALDDPELSFRAKATLQLALETQKRMVDNRRGGVYLTQADFILTERCNLNCRHCCNLMPYIKDKKDYPAKEILVSARRLADASDRIINAVLVGGEPFLYRDLPLVANGLAAMDKVDRVSIYTNGAAMPSAESVSAMRNTDKVHVIVSDYGPLSTKVSALTALLAENGISHDIRRFTGDWRDMGGFAKRGRMAEDMRQVFRGCSTKNCTAIMGGVIRRCPRAAFGARLGFVPDPTGDKVNLLDETMKVDQLRENLRKLLFQRDTILACDYCDGQNVDSPPINPAEQQPWGVAPDGAPEGIGHV